ncbi:hypothetical protein BABINDRAFT_161396 [Babjeviella inositovora NRRL Y-12698]|uniref:N-alpha-acetyltransferase 40 n=1 Tax=Babjeviella inositovora NRRL Y-12698 TaxID=984486 RepID=A0A1E3QPW3_9ASCO|nr:uncharacterized protein BABINDRAFT_161396 [Babjeviella inositovora NRRL Y-12698]ODQ79678.1 hypothetical protein BABINDRAFT_161396 [Babjeviella inositovora NRRL Y-12698]
MDYYDDLDESDTELQYRHGISLAEEALRVFPEILAASVSLQRQITTAAEISPELLKKIALIIDTNLAAFYVARDGPRWMDLKLVEMKEAGLVYVYYTPPTDPDQIACFLSFLITYESGVKVLYLYEVHVLQQFQGKRLGARLLAGLHQLATDLQQNGGALYNPVGTALTVFSDNTKAFAWYKKEKYILSPGSPQDKRLRSGKLRKPEYYIMVRLNQARFT